MTLTSHTAEISEAVKEVVLASCKCAHTAKPRGRWQHSVTCLPHRRRSGMAERWPRRAVCGCMDSCTLRRDSAATGRANLPQTRPGQNDAWCRPGHRTSDIFVSVSPPFRDPFTRRYYTRQGDSRGATPRHAAFEVNGTLPLVVVWDIYVLLSRHEPG